ncbi:FadR/GntR family transcriptional regulator [Rhizobium sp. C4]|uniref:FadR/GntR family transcriptional regulator n=1 Tax=Rhizobium sp. C4 TaxID=1349800 RepID=UPI001E5990F9|nr:FadR/GntR family transcriptional regulator [Rhizobium sp. C4]MCD2172838.1 FadR family transcriptional regulator [Rhizobium sp. C4]
MNSPDALFSPVTTSKTADDVVAQVEALLLDGVLRSGERLPGERDLALRLEVSRPVLRDALKVLEERGLIESRHGGGTYVADIIGEVFSRPLIELLNRHERAALDYLEYRRELEGLTSELAARRANAADRENLARIIGDMRAAHAAGHLQGERDADVELHNAVGECAHNTILLHTLHACYRLLSAGILTQRNAIFEIPGTRNALLAQHERIVETILGGDPAAARQAAEAHIDFVTATLHEAKRSGEWERVSRQRLVSRTQSKTARKSA